jgi:hypothetical protein
MYGGRGISQSFSIISINSIQPFENSTILPESEVSLISQVIMTGPSFSSLNSTCFPGFSFLPG